MRRGHVAWRTCIGCFERYPKDQLVRFVLVGSQVALGDAEGRGLYLCRKQECFAKALERKGPRGLSGRRPGCPDLARLREAVARVKQAASGTIGGGAIG